MFLRSGSNAYLFIYLFKEDPNQLFCPKKTVNKHATRNKHR